MQAKTEVDGSLSTFAIDKHVGDLMNMIRTDSSVGVSLASLLRMMIQIRQEWLVSVGCVRGSNIRNIAPSLKLASLCPFISKMAVLSSRLRSSVCE